MEENAMVDGVLIVFAMSLRLTMTFYQQEPNSLDSCIGEK